MAETPHAHPKSHRREYFIVFAVLFVFTLVEVIVANPKLGINRILVGFTLVLLAITKASFVGYFFMHLKQELRALKLTVVIPFMFPMIYALVLIAEAGWRLVR